MHQKITGCYIIEMSTQIVHELVFLAGIVATGNAFHQDVRLRKVTTYEFKSPFYKCTMTVLLLYRAYCTTVTS